VLEDGRSILDLLGKSFTLIATEHIALSEPGITVHVMPNNPAFTSLYGLEAGGCVLVRPDGYVAARWRQLPTADAVRKAIAKILKPDQS
jgi:hypothetical protein